MFCLAGRVLVDTLTAGNASCFGCAQQPLACGYENSALQAAKATKSNY
jgi:hypothetical protein